MKKLFAFLLCCALSVGIIGCGVVDVPKFDDLEAYQSLVNGISKEDSLEKVVDTFATVCKPLLDEFSSRYLYEVTAEGNDLNIHLAVQFTVPVYKDPLQMNLELVFKSDEDMSAYAQSQWFDGDFDAYIASIKESKLFLKLIGKSFDSYKVSVEKA